MKTGNRLYISCECQQNLCITLHHRCGGLEILCDFREMLSIIGFSETFCTTPGIFSVQTKLSMNHLAFAQLHAAEKMYCNGDVHPFCCRSSHIPYAEMNVDTVSLKGMNVCRVAGVFIQYLLGGRREDNKGKRNSEVLRY